MSDLRKMLETTPDNEWPVGLNPRTGLLNVTEEDADDESDEEHFVSDYDPNQPRDPGGEDGGQWVKVGGYGELEYDEDDGPSDEQMDQLLEASVGVPLSKGEINTFRNYANMHYEDWNTILRHANPTDEEIAETGIARMDYVFAQAAAPIELTAWRKAGPNTSKRIESMNDGDTFTDHGFVSTSLSYTQASKFTPVHSFKDSGEVFRITVPKGYPAVPMTSKLSESNEEKELLLKRGTKFRVRKTSNVVRLEVIP